MITVNDELQAKNAALGQARDFAKSMGVLAKTDQVDARTLRDFADVLIPRSKGGGEQERRVKANASANQTGIRFIKSICTPLGNKGN